MIKKISENTEFALIISIVFGFFILQSFLIVLNPPVHAIEVTNSHLIQLIFLEIILASIAFYILYQRGWSPSDLHILITLKETGWGILLWVTTYGSYALIYIVAAAVFGSHAVSSINMNIGEINPVIALTLSIVNPLFEEIFVVAYVVQVLEKKHDAFFVISVSTFIRFLYHTYQGPIAAVSILPMGLLHAYVFWRWRKMWPLIFSHCIFNIISFV